MSEVEPRAVTTQKSLVLRPTEPGDTPALLELTEQTKVFKPIEIQALHEVLDDYHATLRVAGHRSNTAQCSDRICGFAYFAPAAMTDRTWYLYWIAVAADLHGRGIGAHLLADCETEITRQHGRHLLIETSALPHYEPTRRFYVQRGYVQEAVLHDYYAEGDHMVVFRKRLAVAAEGAVTA